MRILQVVSYLYPALAYGGPAKVVYDLSVELSKNNQVMIYTTDVWDRKKRIAQKNKLKKTANLSIKYFPNIINAVVFEHRLFTSFGMITSYLREKNNFDIVHIHDVYIIPQLLLGLIAILFKKPYVLSPHGVLAPLRRKKRSLLKWLIFTFLAKMILSKAKFLIATSEEEKQILNQLGFDYVKTVFNGISLELFQPTKKFQKFNKSFDLSLLYIGKLHPLKGLDFLLDSLIGVDFTYQLLLAGPDDGMKYRLEKKIKDNKLNNVHFLGFVNENEKAELYKIADLFVHPSLSEGFSISILEALKYGLPVLITNACNFSDIKRFNAGIVIPEKNLVKRLSETLKKIKQGKYNLAEFAKNGRKLVERDYSISAMARKIERIYEVFN